METQTINLKDIVSTEERTVTVAFKHGLSLVLRYVSKQTVTNLFRSSMVRGWDAKSRQTSQQLDIDRFMGQFCKLAVVGWSGATLRTLRKLMPVKGDYTEEQLDAEVAFTQENLLVLVKNCNDLDDFVQNTAMDISVFNPDQEAELGNSEPSQSGN